MPLPAPEIKQKASPGASGLTKNQRRKERLKRFKRIARDPTLGLDYQDYAARLGPVKGYLAVARIVSSRIGDEIVKRKRKARPYDDLMKTQALALAAAKAFFGVRTVKRRIIGPA